MKQRLAGPPNIIDLAKVEGLTGIELTGRSLTIGAMTHARRGRRPRRSCKETIPALAYARRADRRSGGAPSRHDRRLDRQQRSERRLSGRGARPRRHHHHQQAHASRPTISSPACSRPRWRPTRSSPRCSFPIPKKAAYEKFRNPASRYALVGVFVSKRGSEIRVAVTGAGSNGVFRVTVVRGGAEEALRAEVARGPDGPGRRHERATSTAAPNIAPIWSACWPAGRWRPRNSAARAPRVPLSVRHARPRAGHLRLGSHAGAGVAGRDNSGHDDISSRHEQDTDRFAARLDRRHPRAAWRRPTISPTARWRPCCFSRSRWAGRCSSKARPASARPRSPRCCPRRSAAG